MMALDDLILSLQQPLSRDLAWCIFAPQLLSHQRQLHIALTGQRIDWLKALDQHNAPLQQACADAIGLGRYTESLWRFFYQHDPQYRLLAHNLVVQDQGRTLGEFDLIIEDLHSGRCIHQEVACKFFIYSGPPGKACEMMQYWQGPDSRDNLAAKWQKLAQQSVLGQHPAARHLLQQRGIGELDSAISLKGYLFAAPGITRPDWLDKDNYLHQALRLDDDRLPAQLIALEKKHWLNRLHPHSLPISADQAREAVARQQRPLLFACAWQQPPFAESQRFFLLPDHWPDQRALN